MPMATQTQAVRKAPDSNHKATQPMVDLLTNKLRLMQRRAHQGEEPNRPLIHKTGSNSITHGWWGGSRIKQHPGRSNPGGHNHLVSPASDAQMWQRRLLLKPFKKGAQLDP